MSTFVASAVLAVLSAITSSLEATPMERLARVGKLVSVSKSAGSLALTDATDPQGFVVLNADAEFDEAFASLEIARSGLNSAMPRNEEAEADLGGEADTDAVATLTIDVAQHEYKVSAANAPLIQADEGVRLSASGPRFTPVQQPRVSMAAGGWAAVLPADRILPQQRTGLRRSLQSFGVRPSLLKTNVDRSAARGSRRYIASGGGGIRRPMSRLDTDQRPKQPVASHTNGYPSPSMN